MEAPQSKISASAFKVRLLRSNDDHMLKSKQASVRSLFGVAIVLALGRFVVRVRTFNRLLVDDLILLFACLTLIASTSLTYIDLVNDIYEQDTLDQVFENEKLQAIDTVLFWATIFAVKFSFLAFFRGLINRMSDLTKWWWCVLLITIPSAGICMCVNFIACPYIGPGILNCSDVTFFDKQLALLKATTVLDIATDVFIISIPVVLLWRVRITMRQKLALGAVLCLSVFMIIVSIVKVASVYTHGAREIDLPWVQFWGEAEACVAIMVASISAFRSLFLSSNDQKNRQMKQRHQRPEDEKHLALSSSSGALRQKASGGSGSLPPKVPMTILRSALRTFGWDHDWSSSDTTQSTITTIPGTIAEYDQASGDLLSHQPTVYGDIV
ncbi:hypothetical protein MMC25_004117 [Agyrium rufum]|nr:hypothetical protein [Agyrium rufum]